MKKTSIWVIAVNLIGACVTWSGHFSLFLLSKLNRYWHTSSFVALWHANFSKNHNQLPIAVYQKMSVAVIFLYAARCLYGMKMRSKTEVMSYLSAIINHVMLCYNWQRQRAIKWAFTGMKSASMLSCPYCVLCSSAFSGRRLVWGEAKWLCYLHFP